MAKRISMREKMRGKLKERTQESHKNRDSGGSIKTFFNKDKMEEVTTWWAGKNDHIIDIIPYFAGTNDPRNKEDEPSYVLDIEVHRFVGPMEEMVICPEQYGDPCPICEEARRLNRAGADWKKSVKPLKPGRRAVYNVIVRDGGDMEKKGVQVFEIAHWFMEKHLAKIAKDPRGGGFVVFSDPDDGRSVSFERTGVGSDNTGYSGHRFVDRPEPITDDELDGAYCLDDLIDIKSYEEVYEVFYGKPSSSESEVDEPSKESEAVDEEGSEDKTTTKRKKGKRKKGRKEVVEEVCPQGGVIGEDIDDYEECDGCPLYPRCEEIADAL